MCISGKCVLVVLVFRAKIMVGGLTPKFIRDYFWLPVRKAGKKAEKKSSAQPAKSFLH